MSTLLTLPVMAAFTDEMLGEKCASVTSSVGTFLGKHEDALDVAGLAGLAVPNVDSIQARYRARKALGVTSKDVPEDEVEKRRLIPGRFHAAVELAGLGTLSGHSIAKLRGFGH